MYGMCIDAHWQNDGRALSTVQNPQRACALCKISQNCALIRIQHMAPEKHDVFFRDIGMRLCFDYSIVSRMDKKI